MRTTIIFMGICAVCIALLIVMSTKKGREWMRKIDEGR